jgi:methanogenic corrinoid protein MtbC1
MKKPSSKIREEIARLQDQLRAAETREAERIGRIALRAGIGEIDIEEAELQAAFEEIAGRFREGKGDTTRQATARKHANGGGTGGETTATLASGADAGDAGEV